MFNIASLANWKELTIQKQKTIKASNLRENAKCIDFDYTVGQSAYIKNDGIQRILDEEPKTGPFPITDVYTNGTVCIQWGNINEHINIHRLEPHFFE